MRRALLKLTIFCAVIFSLSCHRQEIYDPSYVIANIPITFDWSSSLVDEEGINNVTVYFYPVDGSDPIITYAGSSKYTTVEARAGEYNILVHNEIAGNITGADYENESSYSGYRMSAVDDDLSQRTSYYDPSSGEQLIAESEAVASWKYDGFVVTTDMIEYTRTKSFDDIIEQLGSKSDDEDNTTSLSTDYSALLEADSKSDATSESVAESLDDLVAVPMRPLTTTYELEVEIENMNNIQFIEGVIAGFVDGILVAEKEMDSASGLKYTQFQMLDYTFNEGSTTDGFIKYKFTNLGHRAVSSENYYVTLKIIAHSGELVTYKIEVTEQIADYDRNAVVEIKIGESFDNDTPTIVMPVNINAGFGVTEWGDANDYELGNK